LQWVVYKYRSQAVVTGRLLGGRLLPVFQGRIGSLGCPGSPGRSGPDSEQAAHCSTGSGGSVSSIVCSRASWSFTFRAIVVFRASIRNHTLCLVVGVWWFHLLFSNMQLGNIYIYIYIKMGLLRTGYIICYFNGCFSKESRPSEQ
jgi:hypothetical protein